MTIRPGATLGVLGGGQLARMFAFEARRMGYHIAVVDPDADASGMQLADKRVVGAFDDLRAAHQLASESAVVTLDTEHIPFEILESIEKKTIVRPSSAVLRVVQDRGRQRAFLAAQHLPQTPHAFVSSLEDLQRHAPTIGFPCILKTCRSGYDGKGQVRIHKADELKKAWLSIQQVPAVLEAFVEFTKEISILLVRGVDGETRFYPIAENEHRNHILHITRAPAEVSEKVVHQAQQMGSQIASALGHVGMMAVELFVTQNDELFVNEIAPRTHNSGHYTLGGCATSQFEQHVRAVCGLPLGDTTLARPAVMLNLLGDLWARGEPDWQVVLKHPEAHLHLYGKRAARPGRKMGHVLVLADPIEHAVELAESIYGEITEREG